MKRDVTVYKSRRVADMYLFVDASEDLARVPEALLQRFGEPVEALRFELSPERELARADAALVMEQLDSAGFFLQMPPDPTELNLE